MPLSSRVINPPIIRLAKDARVKTILDAGCGNGFLAGQLSELGYDVMGVDTDKGGVEIASRKFPKANFSVGNFSEAPARSNNDLVVSTEVVEHLYSPHELVNYAFQAVKPGGTFAISTPYHGYLKNVAISATDRWDHHHGVSHHGGHIKFWSRKTLTALLESAGFKVDGFIGVGRMPYLWMSMILTAQRPL